MCFFSCSLIFFKKLCLLFHDEDSEEWGENRRRRKSEGVLCTWKDAIFLFFFFVCLTIFSQTNRTCWTHRLVNALFLFDALKTCHTISTLIVMFICCIWTPLVHVSSRSNKSKFSNGCILVVTQTKGRFLEALHYGKEFCVVWSLCVSFGVMTASAYSTDIKIIFQFRKWWTIDAVVLLQVINWNASPGQTD